MLTFSLTLLALVALVALFKHFFSYWKKRGLNYLEPTIPFGNTVNVCFGKCGLGEMIQSWYLEMKEKGWKHGGAYFIGKPIYVPIDNDLIKKIIVSDFLSFPNHGFHLDEKGDPLSGHVFNMENYKWKNLRAKLPSIFTAAKMRANVAIMERFSRELSHKLEEFAASKTPVDVKNVLSRFTTDAVFACLYGVQSDTLKNQNDSLVTQSRRFFDDQWSRTTNALVLLVPRPILKMLKFKTFQAGTTNYFLNFFGDVKRQREKATAKRSDLADLLIGLCDESKALRDFNGKGTMEPLNFEEFVAQMLVFFEAGFETSSGTLTFAMYELGANPDVQDKLRREIDAVLQKHDGKVTYDSVNEMEYLGRVVDETLRKYPVLPIIPRLCVRDYHVPGTDVVIEKDTLVVVSNFGIHYDPEYYPDPTKFDPERFTSENKAKRPFCSYLPFGEGPRVCVGKRFGLWQTKIGLATIVKNYKISVSEKMKVPLRFASTGLILKANEDVWVDLDKI